MPNIENPIGHLNSDKQISVSSETSTDYELFRDVRRLNLETEDGSMGVYLQGHLAKLVTDYLVAIDGYDNIDDPVKSIADY